MSTTPLSDCPATTDSASQFQTGTQSSGREVPEEVRSRNSVYPPCKAVVEYLAAIVLLLLAVPFILIAALLIKLTSRGSVFYLQTRLGKNGRPYRLIKLRTMVAGAERETGPVWATANDTRITAVGRFLRDTHIDEFPQLINVLLGHMALIGPRPERPEIAEGLEWQVPGFSQRLNVRPGITGLAQLNLPADSDVESVQKKLQHDLYYIRFRGPWLDLRILSATGWLLVKTLFRLVWRSWSLPSEEKIYSRADRLAGPSAELSVDRHSSPRH